VIKEPACSGMWCGMLTGCIVWATVGAAVVAWAAAEAAGPGSLCKADKMARQASESLRG